MHKKPTGCSQCLNVHRAEHFPVTRDEVAGIRQPPGNAWFEWKLVPNLFTLQHAMYDRDFVIIIELYFDVAYLLSCANKTGNVRMVVIGRMLQIPFFLVEVHQPRRAVGCTEKERITIIKSLFKFSNEMFHFVKGSFRVL